ncbi:hypothetical protein NDU88_005392 [Pleurodeles waltl]|uniref:Uncharacterized protein n=1 Tax=Pleurodeles waltl TaxID=8319 RepID=A0AAV7MW76_PLEWA|nr:hypothetical protein NDU88_005392 [Pleurodeles waltl]
MPKRSYPFGECSPLQLKTHVGQKQLCDGVSGDFFKREIFEKTKKLLFSGAQTYMNRVWNGSKPVVNCAIPHSPDHGSENKTSESCEVNGLLQGQTLIGQDGKLLKSSNHEKSTVPMGVSKACSSLYSAAAAVRSPVHCVPIVDDADICEKAFCYGCSLFEVSP